MCPIPPTTFFNELAVNEAVPKEIQAVAAKHVKQAKLADAVNGAHLTVPPPTTGHGPDDFYCTIYSMNNKAYPKFIAEQMNDKDGTNLTEDDIRKMMKEGKLYTSAILELPGDLIQKGSEIYPTKIYQPNPDGTYPPDGVRHTCYNNFHTVWKFFKTCFQRNSIDGKGLEIRATVHISRGYDNAYWVGDQSAMFFGDGGRFDGRGWLASLDEPEVKTWDLSDPELVKKFTEDEKFHQKLLNALEKAGKRTNWESPLALDITGHELTHGVVQYTANLGKLQADAKDGPAYREAKTLDEHIADCFGIMIKHWSKNQTAAEGNWDIGEGWWSKTAMELGMKVSANWYLKHPWTESYMRTFKKPAVADRASQPDQGAKHMDNITLFDSTTDPHENCGIPNHAFYLAALEFHKQDNKPTWENVGKIWYNALTDPAFKEMKAQTFKGWRDLTTQHAEKLKLYKSDGKTIIDGKAILENAWKAVGL